MLHHKKALLPNAGYTLIELCLVISLIGLLAVISLPRLSKALWIHADLNRLYAYCTYLRRKAMITQEVQTMKFGKRSYSADLEIELSHGVCFGTVQNILGPPGNPHKKVAGPLTWPRKILRFYPDGTMSAGAAYLTDGSCMYALTIDASEISMIRRYRYDTQWKWLKC